jgi:hypothetical protein
LVRLFQLNFRLLNFFSSYLTNLSLIVVKIVSVVPIT